MQKIQLTILVGLTCTNLAMAGGDINPISTYEVNDAQVSEIVPITPIVKAPTPIVKAPTPIVKAPLAVAKVSPIYVGLGLVAARYDTKCKIGCTNGGIDKTAGVLVRAGYDFNKYMGLEARGMMTSIKDNGGKIQHIGAFVKPMYPVTDGLNIYALGGYAKTKTSGSMRTTDVSGLAFGAGLEYDFSDDKKKDAKYDREFDGLADQEKGFGVFADYERLYYKSGSPDLDALSVGLTYDF